MRQFILGLVAGLICYATVVPHVYAARLEKAGDNKVVYIDVESGKQVDALEADRQTTMDKPVLQCKHVEKVCSERTGKCTIKVMK